MKAQVHNDWSLLDQSKIDTVLFHLPFDLFAKIIAPNMFVFQVNICYQLFIQVNLIMTESLCKLKLFIGLGKWINLFLFIRSLFNYFILQITMELMMNIWWVHIPGNLFPYFWIKSLPLIIWVSGLRELPENLFHWFCQNRISKKQDIHTY